MLCAVHTYCVYYLIGGLGLGGLSGFLSCAMHMFFHVYMYAYSTIGLATERAQCVLCGHVRVHICIYICEEDLFDNFVVSLLQICLQRMFFSLFNLSTTYLSTTI